MFGRVRGELEAVAAGFDPALIDARTASEELDEVVAIENIAAGMRARLAARVAETGIWRETGERSAAEALARRTGVTVRDAKATIATGRKLRELPATAEAAARGELSSSQTAAIADAASADAHAEGPLLEQAQRGSLQELRDECARTKAKVIDLEERRRQIHAERSVRDWVDGEGVGKLLMEDNPEVIAAVASRLRTEGERRMEAVPRDEREPLVAYLADALHDLVCTAPATDENLQSRRTHPDVKMLVRVDLPVLLRGYPMGRDAGDEVCEIVGYGPVATSVIHDLLDTADPFLAAIATDGDQVLGVAHLGRRANAKQQSALEWLYPTCTVEGCTRSTYLENDHREDWATTHLTVLDWLDRPCAHHHRLKTHHGWALVEGHGKRPMVPPEDPAIPATPAFGSEPTARRPRPEVAGAARAGIGDCRYGGAAIARRADMRDGLRIIDSDAHVIEPHALWTDYLDPDLRDRAPRPVGLTFGFEFDDFSVNLPQQWSPDATPDEMQHMSDRIQATYAELFPAAYEQGFSADAQLVDMDREGIDRAFLYPSFGLFVLASDTIEPVLAVALARAYNDWLADFVATDPNRLFGTAMLPLQDPKGAAAEAERCATELGFRGAFVRPNPIGGRAFDDPAYEDVWSVMSDHSMALGIHEGGFPRLPQVVSGRLTHPQQVHICTHPMEQMISAVSLIYGGVLERSPGLKVAFLEAGCGWVPFWLHRMDEHWENAVQKDFGLTGLTQKPPSEYFRRQCYVSADSSEYMLAQVIELIGDDRIVFTTDYPHPDSPWPHAAEEFLALPGVSEESKRRILWDNALALYGVDS